MIENLIGEKIEPIHHLERILDSYQKVFFIFCDGGLSNRINSLINGLVLCKLVDFSPLVVWPTNNRCDATYEQIFASDIGSINFPLLSFVAHSAQFQLWLHENDIGFLGDLVVLRSLEPLHAQYLMRSAGGKPIIFSESLILPWIPFDLVSAVVRQLRFNGSLLSKARQIIDASGVCVDSEYFGVHLRGTDFPTQPPVDKMLAKVRSNFDKKFFVCSDERSIEQIFLPEPNVFIHDKLEYVTKIQNGPWRAEIMDSDGLPYTSNIYRSKCSVEDAVVDLLLLANSTLVSTSNSTFLGLSNLLKTSGWVMNQFRSD